MVAAGWCHALALNKQGDVAAWGFNLKGQLGLMDTRTRKIPTLVPAPIYIDPKNSWNMVPPEWNAKMVGAGSFYSVVVQQDDKVYTFGGKSFPLGLGYEAKAGACCEPKLVQSLLDRRVRIERCC